MTSRAPSPSLRDLQRWFLAQTTRRDARIDDSGVARVITAGPGLSAAERLDIYRAGYSARLIECLADDYPALAFALGPEAFEASCLDYVERYPSRSPSLDTFGATMARHVATRREPWARFGAELARLEWALVEVVHAPLGDRLSSTALAALDPSNLGAARLEPTPALRVLVCDYPVNAFYQAFREEASPHHPAPTPSGVAVYREGFTLWRMDLEPNAARLLSDLTQGVALGQAVSAAAERAPDGALDLVRELPRWLESWTRHGFFQRALA